VALFQRSTHRWKVRLRPAQTVLLTARASKGCGCTYSTSRLTFCTVLALELCCAAEGVPPDTAVQPYLRFGRRQNMLDVLPTTSCACATQPPSIFKVDRSLAPATAGRQL